MENNKVFVVGSKGQLGSSLENLSKNHSKINFHFLSRKDIDLEDIDLLSSYFYDKKFHTLINASSYNKVDEAEKEKDSALLMNHIAVKKMAEICESKSANFIHVSTDYVFSGKKNTPYVEEDEPQPVNFYGFSKMMGEEATLESCKQSVVIRTSWVISKQGINFAPKVVELLKTKKQIKVVEDQMSSPTLSDDLATFIFTLISTPKLLSQCYQNILHYSSKGAVSRYEIAQYLKDKLNSSCEVIPCGSSEFPALAQRPFYSYLSKNKTENLIGIKIPSWQDCLDRFLL